MIDKLKFCTLFDSNYMAKGLCMYDSLAKNCPDFHLYIFAFDDVCYKTLVDLQLENVTVVSLHNFEDEELLRVKPTRSKAEYCWTCTSSTILYCIKHFNLDHCTYLDSDLYFYSNPRVLIEEMGDNDVLITEHRYTPEYDQSVLSGKYCVQFMTFRNTENGQYILRWWRDACIDWCYARREDGKFGDQKYLDDWTTRFEGVHELFHLGGGVAPWNVQQYQIEDEDNHLSIYCADYQQIFDLVFYHFHYFHNYRMKWIFEFYFGYYLLSKDVLRYLYKPYIYHLKKWDRLLSEKDSSIDSLGTQTQQLSWCRLMGHLLKNLTKPNRINWLRAWHD